MFDRMNGIIGMTIDIPRVLLILSAWCSSKS